MDKSLHHIKQWDTITRICPTFHGSLVKQLKLGIDVQLLTIQNWWYDYSSMSLTQLISVFKAGPYTNIPRTWSLRTNRNSFIISKFVKSGLRALSDHQRASRAYGYVYWTTSGYIFNNSFCIMLDSDVCILRAACYINFKRSSQRGLLNVMSS